MEQDDDYESKRLGREIYSTLHLLGSETMPNLIMYLKNITSNGEGITLLVTGGARRGDLGGAKIVDWR